MSHLVTVIHSYQPSTLNQSPLESMLNLGNSTAEVSSATAEIPLITVSWLSDMTTNRTTSSRTLGENLGENQDTLLWLLETLAAFVTLHHIPSYDQSIFNLFEKKIILSL